MLTRTVLQSGNSRLDLIDLEGDNMALVESVNAPGRELLVYAGPGAIHLSRDNAAELAIVFTHFSLYGKLPTDERIKVNSDRVN